MDVNIQIVNEAETCKYSCVTQCTKIDDTQTEGKLTESFMKD